MPVVDVHTHVYTPSYIALLKSRKAVPCIRTSSSDSTDRLIILPSEDLSMQTATGRPVGPEYTDMSIKLKFMDDHGIDISVLSLANPWIDFLPASTAAAVAREINDDINDMCAERPGRLFAFGVLPLSAGVAACVEEIARIKGLQWMRGVVCGSAGMGEGMDDSCMDGLYAAVEAQGLPLFLHPHYGLPSQVYGPRAGEYGHILPLALGFPIETTIAATRMLLSGVFERFPELTTLLAHSGGTLPFLAGRLDSCIAHDGHFRKANIKRDVWEVLKKNILLDAVVYSEAGLQTAVTVSSVDRVLFGTDHPFFPPPLSDNDEQKECKKWPSVGSNLIAAAKLEDHVPGAVAAILGENAVKLLKLSA